MSLALVGIRTAPRKESAHDLYYIVLAFIATQAILTIFQTRRSQNC